jgi:Rrf2 family protein
MLSNQSQYAIRGVLYLALHADKENKLGSARVSEQTSIPAPFLAKIFQKLSREGLIISTKGPRGGFYLSEEELQNSLLNIIECIDGLEVFNSCFIGLPKCSDSNPCAIHHVAANWRDALIAELKLKTIAEMAETAKTGNYRVF